MAAAASKKDQPLSNDYWAVICTIKQEPNYRFIRNERTMAEKMADLGLLERQDNKRYAITTYGERCYKAEKLLAVKQ